MSLKVPTKGGQENAENEEEMRDSYTTSSTYGQRRLTSASNSERRILAPASVQYDDGGNQADENDDLVLQLDSRIDIRKAIK